MSRATQTMRMALMQPSFSGLFVTCAYLPQAPCHHRFSRAAILARGSSLASRFTPLDDGRAGFFFFSISTAAPTFSALITSSSRLEGSIGLPRRWASASAALAFFVPEYIQSIRLALSGAFPACAIVEAPFFRAFCSRMTRFTSSILRCSISALASAFSMAILFWYVPTCHSLCAFRFPLPIACRGSRVIVYMRHINAQNSPVG
ncbi:hypothetical protein J8273_6348 [Carpediemonas membranifera]|uniref:Uncharacterized protein n=1 Tax=Carpediemonas membranifera TaxID=201153 RepID=A0A8J6E031_9EUKA|nr:hypothetical protein J8273_6348 [Carpediemonas membranifera]|eukprot:KAG9391583.1 hypothetical protein J8273_6348 [Carpediemonas membranifera]